MTRLECEQFPVGSRRRKLCDGTADLPEGKINAWRERNGLRPLTEFPDVPRHRVVRHPGNVPIRQGTARGGANCGCSVKRSPRPSGPGTELVLLLHAAGVPTCQQCIEAAKRMDDWGVTGCRERFDEIVDEIMPRARKWVAENKPWINKLLPGCVKDIEIRRRVGNYVTQAIDNAEKKSQSLDAIRQRVAQPVHTPRTPFETVDEDTHFVWIYWSGGAEADEILWSIRSVEYNYAGRGTITVIGDRPPGFDGHVIEQKRVKKQPFRRFRDTLAKMKTLAHTNELPDQVVWCMDDCYFLKQGFRRADIAEPKKHKRITYQGKSEWSQMQQATERQLRSAGLPQEQYTTHLPQVVDRKKLIHVFETFDFSAVPLCWESLYGNLYHPDAGKHNNALHRVSGRGVTAADCELVKRSKIVLNHHHGSWSSQLATWLKIEFPPKAES